MIYRALQPNSPNDNRATYVVQCSKVNDQEHEKFRELEDETNLTQKFTFVVEFLQNITEPLLSTVNHHNLIKYRFQKLQREFNFS